MPRTLKWSLAGLLAVLVIAIAAGIWLVTTEAGLARAVAIAQSLDAVQIRIEGASGRLAGPLRAQRIEIAHPRAAVRIVDFEADYEPLEILAGRITAEAVRVSEAEIRMNAREGPRHEPRFMPGWLTLAIDEASVGRLRVVSPRGTELGFSDIRGSAWISQSEIEFRRVRAAAPAWQIAGASGTLRAGRPIGVNVTSAWSLTAERRITGIARAAGDFDRLAVDSRIAAPGEGQVFLELRDLTGAFRFEGEAGIGKLDLAQWIDDPPFGPLSGSFSLEGDRNRYAIAGTILGKGLPEAGVRVDSAASYSDRVVTISSLSLDAPDLAARLEGTVAVGGEPSFDVRASWAPVRWPLTGDALLRSPRGTLEARGWREFEYRVTGRFVAGRVPPFAGEASGRFTDESIVVEDSAWTVLGGRVQARAMLGRRAPRDWNVAGRASDIDPSGFRAGLPGELDFRFSASGVDFGEDAPLEASLRDLSGTFRGQPASGSGALRRGAGRTEFQDVALALGPARLELDGAWGREADLDARLVADELSAFLPGLAGEVNATMRVREREIAVAVRGHDLAFRRHRAVVLSVDAHIDREGREHSWLRLRSNGLEVAGFPITDTRLSVDGLVHDHAMGFRVGAGDDAVVLRGRGAWKDERYTLALERIVASGPRIAPWRLESPTRVSASDDSAGLEPACLVYDERRLCVEGSWKRGAGWSFAAETDSFPLEVLDSDAPGKPRYRGFLVFDARASGTPGEPWRADVRAEIRNGALIYRSASGAERTVSLGLTRLALESDRARHRLELRVTESAALDLAVGLEARRTPGRPIGELPVQGTVEGRTQQTNLLPLVIDAIDNASGEIALDFRVAGRVAAPLLEGEARLRGGTLDIYQTNLRLREVESTVRLEDSSLSLEAAAKAGEGSLDIDGRLAWQDRRLNGRLTLAGERLLVADVPEARIFASPDLRFALNDRRIDVTGTVEIPQARIAPADTAGAVLVSGDERIVGAEAEASDDRGFAVSTDIRLALGEKVEIEAYGLSGNVTGGIRAHSAPEQGALATGELEVVDGEYKIYGRELDVERGRLLFTGGPVADPGVDLRASRKLAEYRVGVIARGPLRRPQLTLFSEPSLPQAQIASLLVVGRASLQREEGDAPSPSLAAGGGAFLAGRIGERVGLDEVGVAEETGGGTSLVIGKYLSPWLYVSYGISLVDQINTLKLRYTIGDRWVVAAESGEQAAIDIEYRIED